MSSATELVYHGKSNDFIVFLDSVKDFEAYKAGDHSIALSDILSKFNIYVSATGYGTQGTLENASKQMLEEEFGSYKSAEDEIIPKILAGGKIEKKKTSSFKVDARETPKKEKDLHTSHGKVVE